MTDPAGTTVGEPSRTDIEPDAPHDPTPTDIGRAVGHLWAARRDGLPDPADIDAVTRRRVQAVLERLGR